MSEIVPVKMPKWGLSMIEGKIVEWHKAEGDTVAEGDDLVDIETSKITNIAEAPAAGPLRRVLAKPDETLPVGALIAVIADASVSDADIDAFVTDYQANFVPEVDDEAEGGVATRTITANGVSLRVGVWGEEAHGAPVVLLHGFSADLNNWLFTAPVLAEKRPVYALDLPGHGESEKTVGDGSIAWMAATVVAALDALEVSKAHLVGHSMGGLIAARIALDHPDRIASLSLLASAGLPGCIINEGFLTGIATGMRAKDVKPWLEEIVATPALITKDMIDAMVKYKRLDGVEECLLALRDNALNSGEVAGLEQQLAAIPSALVIASKNDKIVGAPDPARLPAGWTVTFLDQTGHMPHLEAAGDVNAALEAHFG